MASLTEASVAEVLFEWFCKADLGPVAIEGADGAAALSARLVPQFSFTSP